MLDRGVIERHQLIGCRVIGIDRRSGLWILFDEPLQSPIVGGRDDLGRNLRGRSILRNHDCGLAVRPTTIHRVSMRAGSG